MDLMLMVNNFFKLISLKIQ